MLIDSFTYSVQARVGSRARVADCGVDRSLEVQKDMLGRNASCQCWFAAFAIFVHSQRLGAAVALHVVVTCSMSGV